MTINRLTRLTTILLILAASSSLLAQGHGGGCNCGKLSPSPAIFEIDHPDGFGLLEAAREEFNKWNAYANVFSYRNGDNAVSYTNGVNELAFLDSDTLEAVYGIRFGDGTYGITLPRPASTFGTFDACHTKPSAAVCSGIFSEADVALNINFPLGWDLEGPPSFNLEAPAYYGTTVAHEIGHALGFHHNFTNLSVMQYYEDAAGIYVAMSDANAARELYAAQMKQVSDLGTYPFYYDPTYDPGFDQPGIPYESTGEVAFSPTNVSPGGQLTVRNMTLENVGTRHLADVRLRLYLSQDRTYSSNDITLGELRFSGGAGPNQFWDDESEGRTFTVPSGVPTGSYHIVGRVLYDGGSSSDPVTYNNTWSTESTVSVGSGAGTGPCISGTTTLCLQAGRYEVKTQATFGSRTEPGHQTRVSDQFGYFSVPGLTGDPSNIEIFIKITGQVPPSNKNWIFFGGISGFTVDIDVRDTVTGRTKRYTIPGGSYQGGARFEDFP